MGGASPRKKKSAKQLIRESKRAVRKVKVCTRADLVDELETLEAQLKAIEPGDSLAGDPRVAELTARMAELREEMTEATIEFRIRGLSERQYTELVAQHPPRKDDKRDQVLGMNIDEVVEQLIRRGTEDPELDDEDWEHLLGETLNPATYEQLTNAAWSVNNRDVSVPF